jgi:hypothetical protein
MKYGNCENLGGVSEALAVLYTGKEIFSLSSILAALRSSEVGPRCEPTTIKGLDLNASQYFCTRGKIAIEFLSLEDQTQIKTTLLSSLSSDTLKREILQSSSSCTPGIATREVEKRIERISVPTKVYNDLYCFIML